MNRGFSTIELMIAMAIMTMVLSAVVIVSFGNQMFLAGSQTNAEAMSHAQELIEKEQALARKDFNLVNSISSTTPNKIGEMTPDIFEVATYVKLLPDYLTKEVKSLVSWTDERQQRRQLELTTLIANFDTPVGGNTCDSSLAGNWGAPIIENSTTNFAQLVGDPSGTYTLSDIDAYQGKLYVTASGVSGSTKPTFFIFDISTPTNPVLLRSVDNESAGGTTSVGPNAVRVAQDTGSSPVKTYAYLANNYGANYTICDPVSTTNCGQLDIFDVTDPAAPVFKVNGMIASSSGPKVKGTQARGNSLYYRNGYLFLGLTATGAGNGPEFHIIDVHTGSLASLFDPLQKHIMYPVGSIAVGNDVNAIAMRGTYVYFATPNTAELQIYSIANPAIPTSAGSFNSSSGAGNGKTMYLVGDTLYLGKTVPNTGNDLHILNNTNPASTLSELGGVDIPSSANAIITRDYLSFVLTNTDLRLYRTDTPSNISLYSSLTLPLSGSATEPSMDCEGNRMYITSNDPAGKGSLYVIKPGS